MSPVTYQPSRNHFGGFFRLAEIALHHVRAAHQHKPGWPTGTGSRCFRVNDPHATCRAADGRSCRAWRRPAGNPAARKSCVLTATAGRAFGAAVAFQRADAELFLERRASRSGSFSAPVMTQAQAAEIFGRAAAHVELQERRRRQQERDARIRCTSGPMAFASSGLG